MVKAKSSDSLTLNYPYINYTTKDGLPSNETYCVLQDSRGYIWIGTDRGLVKYDGYEFKTYTTYDGLLNNGIVALFEDETGKVWYSTLNAMIGYIEPELNVFGDYKYQSKIDSILKINHRRDTHFNEMEFDAQGKIYLSHSEVGFVYINQKGNLEANLDRTRELDIYINKINDNYKIFRRRTSGDYNLNLNVFLNNELIHTSKINGFAKYSDPQIIQYKDTLYVYDKQFFQKLSTQGKMYESIPFNKSVKSYRVGKRFIYNVLENNNDIEGALYLSDSPLIAESKHKILDKVYISNVLEDVNNGMWISTLKNGIYYYPSLSHLTSSTIPINGIIPILNNKVLINSKRFTNYLYNSQNQSIKRFGELSANQINFEKVFNRHINFNDYVKVVDLERGEKGNVYKEKRFSVAGVQAIDDTSYHYWVPNFIYCKRNNCITRTWQPIRHMKRLESFYYVNDSLSLFSGQEGLYINSRDTFLKKDLEGLFSSNPRVENLTYFKDKGKIVCSVLGEGIYVLNKDYNVLHHITSDDGLVSNTINQLYVDQDSIIWVGTNNGINTLELKRDTFDVKSVLSSSLVLPSPNITQLYKEDSILYVGTDQGISIININDVGVSQVFPLNITSIKISDQIFKRGNTYQLEYDQNDIEIQYLGIAYGHHGQLNYRYRLLGLSDHWITTTERKATFLQLSSGIYTFELEVQNEYGDWIGLENPLEFTIHKPYWSTWWFIGGGVLLGILIIGGALYYYISNLKKEKAFLENEQQLSNELNESQQKALSSQLNPHFVFNSLNSIQNFILTRRTELSSDYLSMFSKLMRYIFENSKKLYVPLNDEIEALRLYLDLEQVRHNHKFDYKIQSDGVQTASIFIPSLLIQPMIENAIWHGLLHKASDDRLLEVTFNVDNTYLYIEVKDNGVGRGIIQPRKKFIKKQKSSGVELTKQRLNLLSQSTGMKTNFEIIDLYNREHQSTGTCVKIFIPISLGIEDN